MPTQFKPPKKNGRGWGSPLLFCLMMALPCTVYAWLFPYISSLTLGSDYNAYPLEWQIELQFSLKYGCFPLYVPGFSGGISAATLSTQTAGERLADPQSPCLLL